MRRTKKFQLNRLQQDEVVKHLPFADMLAKQFANRNVDYEDLRQEAHLALCYAIMNYAHRNNATFMTFSSIYIDRCVKHFVKRYSRTQMLSIDDVITVDEDGEGLTAADLKVDPDHKKKVDAVEYRMIAEQLMKALSEEDRRIVRCAFEIEHVSQVRMRIWQRFGLSKAQYYARVKQAVHKMSLYAKKMNINQPFNI